jgi:hypothetical protein
MLTYNETGMNDAFNRKNVKNFSTKPATIRSTHHNSTMMPATISVSFPYFVRLGECPTSTSASLVCCARTPRSQWHLVTQWWRQVPVTRDASNHEVWEENRSPPKHVKICMATKMMMYLLIRCSTEARLVETSACFTRTCDRPSLYAETKGKTPQTPTTRAVPHLGLIASVHHYAIHKLHVSQHTSTQQHVVRFQNVTNLNSTIISKTPPHIHAASTIKKRPTLSPLFINNFPVNFPKCSVGCSHSTTPVNAEHAWSVVNTATVSSGALRSLRFVSPSSCAV